MSDRSERFELAEYAYHNCQFAVATRHLESAPPSVDGAILRVKCLCELDQGPLAKAYASLAIREYQDSGELHYYRGMASYLSDAPADAMDAMFSAAIERGFAGGNLGKAFLSFAARDVDRAMRDLDAATGLSSELEHVKQLMAFQILLDNGKFSDAEERLSVADQILKESPSLLRSLWGQICWVRLMSATRCFDIGGAMALRLLDQISVEKTPRLHRNAKVLCEQLTRRDGVSLIDLPAATLQERAFPPEEITRKPVLNSLWHFLAGRGLNGATKDDIVSHVWGQAYNPLAHDDRLYKSIGRLRKLLGDDQECPRVLYLRGAHYVIDVDRLRAGRLAQIKETECTATVI